MSYDRSQPFGEYDVYRPHGSSPSSPRRAVVFIHGGGFFGGDKDEAQGYADDLCAQGYVVIAPNYRLASATTRWPIQLQDVWAALRNIRANRESLGITAQVGVMGVSAGGMLAMLTHLRDDPQDPGNRPPWCIDISGEMDLTLGEQCFSNWDNIMAQLVGPPPYDPAVLRAMSPISYVQPDAHTLMLHSTADGNVYIANADEMHVALAGTDTRYARFDGWAHGDDIWIQCASGRGEVFAFLDSHSR